jgi:hypothetical protein
MERMIQQSTRPSSIYGQPSLTDKPYTNSRGNHNDFYRTQEFVSSPDGNITFSGNGHNRHNGHASVITKIGVRDTKSMPKRHVRQYKPSKSDSVFATTNRSQNNGPKELNSNDKIINRNKLQSSESFAVR